MSRVITSSDGLPISENNPLPVVIIGESVITWHIVDDSVAIIEDGKIVITGTGETEFIVNINGIDHVITLQNGGD